MGLYLASESDLKKAAADWITTVNSPALVFLTGDLGAGKTSFVRAALHALGLDGKVKSPTFSLLETYHVNGNIIHHMDLYRLAEPEELEYLGFRDLLTQADYLFIEWPGQAQGYLPEPTHHIHLDYANREEHVGRELNIVDLNTV